MKCSKCGYELPNKTNFDTVEKKVCPKCNTVYNYEENKIDFETAQIGHIYRAYDNSDNNKEENK